MLNRYVQPAMVMRMQLLDDWDFLDHLGMVSEVLFEVLSSIIRVRNCRLFRDTESAL